MTLPTNVICPGQRNLLGEGQNFLRVTFMVYWDGASPSVQAFYLHQHRFRLDLSGIAAIEDEALFLLQLYYFDHTPVGVTYLGYEGISLCQEDVETLAWHVMN